MEVQVEEYKVKLHQTACECQEQTEALDAKDQRIAELETELKEGNKGVEMLKDISEKSIAKIEVLENDIKTILKNHENEIDFLIRTNTQTEVNCDRLGMEKKLLNEEVVVLKKELIHLHDEIKTVKHNLDDEELRFNERDDECQKLMANNAKLLEDIEMLKEQIDNDMISYVVESKNMIDELSALKKQKEEMCAILAEKEELLRELRDEVATKDIDMDGVRDELRDEMRDSFSAEINAVTKKYEQQIATTKELQDMKIKELESIFALEKTKMAKVNLDQCKQLQAELERSSETAEEKIRISEIQAEQRLRELESSIEQSIGHEKMLWKNEIDKCQKIAETEIMQCEFEKQDLKALLDAANELMKEKDDKLDELQQRLSNEVATFIKCRDDFEAELKEARKECNRIMTEKYNYQLTLNNTRSTVTILMDRLKKSDSDVEILKKEVECMQEAKLEAETRYIKIAEELQQLRTEADDYRKALTSLRNSSLALERETKEKESIFEKFMSSEEETLETVSKIGKLFNEKIEENIGKYFEMYNDIKCKYDARENYIRDMKALLDEFATGIELARLELDTKDEKLFELQHENKNIKLENMTYKFKCEQFEKYEHEQRVPHPSPSECIDAVSSGKPDKQDDDDGTVSNILIANIINQLEKEAAAVAAAGDIQDVINMGLYSDEDKISAENNVLKEKLQEKSRQIEILQEMVKMETGHATENMELKKKVSLLPYACA